MGAFCVFSDILSEDIGKLERLILIILISFTLSGKSEFKNWTITKLFNWDFVFYCFNFQNQGSLFGFA